LAGHSGFGNSYVALLRYGMGPRRSVTSRIPILIIAVERHIRSDTRLGVLRARDPDKDRINREKHGSSFETAVRVFADPFTFNGLDRVENREEHRQTIGSIDCVTLISVAHAYREGHRRRRYRPHHFGATRHEP
jgi:uncharacterized DUF497 family protein